MDWVGADGSLFVITCVVLMGALAFASSAGATEVNRDNLRAVLSELKEKVEAAKAAGHQTLYAEVPLTMGTKFVETDWDTLNQERRDDWGAYLERQARYEMGQLDAMLAGKPNGRLVPAHPDYDRLEMKENYFCLDGKPVLLPTHRGDPRYVAPGTLYGIVSGVGATRFDYDKTPIWELYQKDPLSHRVYDGGWCGHIIRDKWSSGGAAVGPCVISLDYPPMLEAVRQSIIQKAEQFKQNIPAYGGIEAGKRARILSLDWEYTYQDYGADSARKWRTWLQDRYGTIEALNKIWRTEHRRFEDVVLPPTDWNAETNPAKFYDFGEFNLWRLTDYFLWARNVILKECPGWPITVGGGQPFGTEFAYQGMDEEYLRQRGVIDVFLSETGSRSWGTAVCLDLQHSMDPKAMIHDPEYHSTGGFLPLTFFHGAATVDVYDWKSGCVDRSLPDGYATLRGCLDLRRLGEYIVEFPKASPQVALFYSRASLIQRFPGTRGNETPYTLQLQQCYRAGTILDTHMGFITSRQLREEPIPTALKVIVIPGAYYANADVVARILRFASDGGTVVIMPTSLVADEYNRRVDYLKRLGVQIVTETVPTYLAAKARPGVEMPGTEYAFIQGPIAKTVVQDQPAATILWEAGGTGPAGQLAGRGIKQTIQLTGPHTVLATYEDGGPAVVQKSLGKGQVIYVAMELEQDSASDLLDWVYDRAGVERLLRVSDPKGARIAGLESRTVRYQQGYLTYLYNMTEQTVQARLKARVQPRNIEDLTYARTVRLNDTFEVGPYDFYVLKWD